MENFETGLTANLVSDTTGSLVSVGFKSVIEMIPKRKIKAGDKALDDAIEELDKCKAIPPIRRKRLAQRITDLRNKRRDTFPQHIRFFDVRTQLRIASEAEEYLKKSRKIYSDAVELSTTSKLEKWNAIRTVDYAASHESLPLIHKDSPINLQAGDHELDVFATPTSSPLPYDTSTTPHAQDFLDHELWEEPESLHASTPDPALYKHAAPSPPSPEPSTERMFEPPSYPPSTAKLAWQLKKPFGGKALKQKNPHSLKLNKAEPAGQS